MHLICDISCQVCPRSLHVDNFTPPPSVHVQHNVACIKSPDSHPAVPLPSWQNDKPYRARKCLELPDKQFNKPDCLFLCIKKKKKKQSPPSLDSSLCLKNDNDQKPERKKRKGPKNLPFYFPTNISLCYFVVSLKLNGGVTEGPLVPCRNSIMDIQETLIGALCGF